MGSLEDLFEREEIAFHSYGDIQDVLSHRGKHRLTGPQRNVTIQLAEPFEIEEKVLKEVDLDNLDELRIQASRLAVGESKTTSVVESRIEALTREEVARQEAIRTEQIAKEQLISEWKEAETLEEEQETRRLLKETLPYSLRTAKGWRTKEGLAAFRMVMG